MEQMSGQQFLAVCVSVHQVWVWWPSYDCQITFMRVFHHMIYAYIHHSHSCPVLLSETEQTQDWQHDLCMHGMCKITMYTTSRAIWPTQLIRNSYTTCRGAHKTIRQKTISGIQSQTCTSRASLVHPHTASELSAVTYVHTVLAQSLQVRLVNRYWNFMKEIWKALQISGYSGCVTMGSQWCYVLYWCVLWYLDMYVHKVDSKDSAVQSLCLWIVY